MKDYETEEQQVEALKGWWKENGTSIIVGLFVGISALFGWRYYDDQNNAHLIQASDLYLKVFVATAQNAVSDEIIDVSNTLINTYSDTPYAALSSLALAKTEYEKGNIDEAAIQLELAVKYANDEVIKQIANLRLASVYTDQKKYDEVLVILNMSHDAAFDAHYEELKGDVYLAKGDVEQARVAYDKAIYLLGETAGKWLLLKRKNLGTSEMGTNNARINVVNLKGVVA